MTINGFALLLFSILGVLLYYFGYLAGKQKVNQQIKADFQEVIRKINEDEDKFSAEYPNGGMLEPYDIDREKKLT